MHASSFRDVLRQWTLGITLCLILASGGWLTPLHAASPSVSPWETIHSEDTTDGAPDDRSPEIVASGRVLHTVWVSNIGYSPCYLNYRRSTDGGATWQTRQILQTYTDRESYNSLLAHDSTRLAVDGNDVHVVQPRFVSGTHFELEYFRSTDGGATFESPKTIATGPQSWTMHSTRISAAAGKVAVAYGYTANWNPDPSGHVAVSQNRGESFSTLSAVADTYDPYPYNWGKISCIDLKWLHGRIASIWKTNGTVPFVSAVSNEAATSFTRVNLSETNTESWTPPGDLMQSQWCASTSEAIHLVWNQRNSSGRSALFYARSIDGGLTYETGRDLSEGTIGTEEVRGGRVAMAASGNHVYLCYVANASGGLFLRSSHDHGVSFGPATPLHLPGTSWYGNGECPNIAIDPQDADGSTAWFAFAIPSGYAAASSGMRHTNDGGSTLSPLLMPAAPYDWGNGHPHSFRLCPLSDSATTGWVMLYAGARPNYDADVFFRRLAPEPTPSTAGNRVLRLGGDKTTRRYDLVQVPSAPSLQFTNTVTAELWVRATTTAEVDHSGMEILQWGGNDRSLALRCYNADLTINATFKTTAGSYSLGNGFPLGDHAWHHLAVTYDADAGPMNLRLYVDGHLNHAVTATGAFVPSPQPLMIGGPTLGYSSSQLFGGDVDQLRLWNRALSESEIRASARKATLTGSEVGLAAAYGFDDSVKDLSGNDADGMLLYAATYTTDPDVPAALMTEWSDDFSSNSLQPVAWQTTNSAASFSVDTSLGDVRVSKPVGPAGSDAFLLESVWRAVGDFDVSVDFRDAALTRSQPWGNHLALTCVIGSTTYSLSRSDEHEIGPNICLSAVPGGRLHTRTANPTAGNLRLIRRGTQLTAYLDRERLIQVTCPTDPMETKLSLSNNTTPDAISATFDNFRLAATTLERRWNTFAVPSAPSADDLWNHTLGTVIDASSPTYGAVAMPPILAFGANNGNRNEPEHTVFADFLPYDHEHWMEWHMPTAQTIQSIALWTAYGTPDRSRGIRHFKLQGKLAPEDPWTTLLDTDLPRSYSATAPALAMNLHHPMPARYYRAVFLAMIAAPVHVTGPRVMELDGFDTPFADQPTNDFPSYVHASGLDGSQASPTADPDGDGAPNLLEYAAGCHPNQRTSAPVPDTLGSVGDASNRYFTLTTRLANPIPADLVVEAEFSMDLGNTWPWSTDGVGITDSPNVNSVNRTFRVPFIMGFPPTGFMRLKVSQQ